MRLGALTLLVITMTAARATAQDSIPMVDDRSTTPGALEAGMALVAEGTALGEQNKYELALGKFLTAASEHPSAAHDCYVALAYLRIGRLTLARLWLDAAARRGDARPTWCATTIADELAGALTKRGFVELTVAVVPDDAEVWAGEAHFRGGRAVWLPPGDVGVRAELAGYQAISRTEQATEGTKIALVLSRVVSTQVPPPESESAPAGRSRRGAWIATIAGGAALVGGGVFHALAIRAGDDANAEPAGTPRFETLSDRFTRDRALAIGGYVVGGIGVAVGVWLFVRASGSEPSRSEPQVGLVLDRGSIGVSWSWTR